MGIKSFSIERALQVDPSFMDSDSEDDDNSSPAGSGGDAAAAGSPAAVGIKRAAHEAPGRAAKRTLALEPELLRPAKDKAGEAHGVAPCGHHLGSCTATCEDPELDALLAQQQAEQAARQPKRRRKKLHDLSGVGSVGITARGPLDKYRFNAFVKDLLGERARDIFRCKGVLCIKGQEATKFVFQGVHETICFGPATSGWPPGSEPLNQIVFIGRRLSRRDLVEGLRSCVWVPLPEGWSEHHDPRANRPYYVHAVSGAKQWQRPEAAACALVRSTVSCHSQPQQMQPRRSIDSEHCLSGDVERAVAELEEAPTPVCAG